MRTVSLKRRVTLASLAVLTVALLAFDAFLYVSFRARLTGDLHRELTERAELAQTLAASLAPQQLADRLASGGITARVIKNGRSYVASPPRPPAPAAAKRAGKHLSREPAPKSAGHGSPPAARPRSPAVIARGALTMTQPLTGGERLVLSADRTQLDHDLEGLLVLEAAGTLAVLLIVAVVLGRILGRALSPLDRTTQVASAIAHGQARQRLAPERTDTELGRMAQAFDQMLDRLQAALDAAHASEGRMREFLGDAAHELRTPIQAIQAGAESLLRDDHDHQQHERLAVHMIRDSARAGRLVEDLVTINRLDNNPDLHPTQIDLAELAREQLARAEVLAPTLHLRYEGPVRCPVQADRDRLAQVIVNLLDNARHATPDHGTITLAIEPTDARIALTVTDNGPGIAADHRERIFERFVRLDASRTRNTFGSGLGLPIARRIAHAHGGTLTCTEPTGASGARFELTLPHRPPTPARQAPDRSSAAR